MYKLDDHALLEKCDRIKEMIERVAADPKRQQDYYAKSHHWELYPVAELSEIEEFEKNAGVELPIEYIYYLTQVGGGGASPGTEFRKFDPEWGMDEELSKESRQLSYPMSNDEWEQTFGDDDLDDYDYGTLGLCGMDLTFTARLILTGPMRGKVVYLDYGSELAPMWPKGFPDFLSWCESFYTELLAGYDIKPTWEFMWHEPGDADALINAFQSTDDKKYREDVLYSFCKFTSLSSKAYEFLKGISDSEFGDIVEEVFEHFDHKAEK